MPETLQQQESANVTKQDFGLLRAKTQYTLKSDKLLSVAKMGSSAKPLALCQIQQYQQNKFEKFVKSGAGEMAYALLSVSHSICDPENSDQASQEKDGGRDWEPSWVDRVVVRHPGRIAAHSQIHNDEALVCCWKPEDDI